ncbi:conserved hypothetical protein [Sporisorium reilianum SRZ2]|uniref:pectinesterase n=1 Tax=Sporisorium reilianum (strain SRZ2) TaxID=999809 RepID=E7A2Z7_SPORE|nr:conserved hypothetical protein [Sporisorium reilianum SRZ2]
MRSFAYFPALYVVLTLLATLVRAAPVEGHPHTGALKEQCQAPKTSSDDPLAGCPRGTVFVSQKHPNAAFRTINAAVSALPDDGSTRTVLIDEGMYYEKVVVSRISPTIFAGITPNVRDPLANRVRMWQSSYVNQSDAHSTLRNCDAVVLGVGTGAPVGSADFKAYNIDFVQRQFFEGQEVTQYQLGPAAALCVQRSNASFYGCGFASYQDTLYVGDGAQAFFFASVVRGMTDQLYGSGKAWFERVKLLSRACGGGITAWRGDPADPSVGVYVSNSHIDRSDDASTLKNLTARCHLGRPWNVYSHATYLNTTMSDIVNPDGFRVWGQFQSNFDPKLTRFAEYASSGPGGNLELRNTTLERILTEHEAKQITFKRVFGGDTHWIDAKPVQQW